MCLGFSVYISWRTAVRASDASICFWYVSFFGDESNDSTVIDIGGAVQKPWLWGCFENQKSSIFRWKFRPFVYLTQKKTTQYFKNTLNIFIRCVKQLISLLPIPFIACVTNFTSLRSFYLQYQMTPTENQHRFNYEYTFGFDTWPTLRPYHLAKKQYSTSELVLINSLELRAIPQNVQHPTLDLQLTNFLMN